MGYDTYSGCPYPVGRNVVTVKQGHVLNQKGCIREEAECKNDGNFLSDAFFSEKYEKHNRNNAGVAV